MGQTENVEKAPKTSWFDGVKAEYPAKCWDLDPVTFTETVFGIILYKIHFYIRSSFFLISRETTLMMKKS